MTIDVFDQDRTMTLETLATRLNVSVATVRRWQSQGMKTTKVGRQTFTNMECVNAFLNHDKTTNATIQRIEKIVN